MRDFKGMKRQRGRNRNGGGGGGGGRPQHNANRAFDSNGPDGVKVRGAAQHVYERYQQFARDAHTAGDRVVAENYLQHAEHYFRVMRAMQPQRPLSEIVGRDQFVSGFDIDFEDEGGGSEGAEQLDAGLNEGGDRQERPDGRPSDRQERFEGRQGDGPRDDRPRDDRPRDDRPRDDRARDDRPREDRFQGDRQQRGFRYDRPRYNRDDQAPGRFDRPDQTRREVPAPSEAERGATGGETPERPSPVLRADDGEVNHAPAFLQVRPAEPRENSSAEPRRPRRRKPPVSPGDGQAAIEDGEADG
jgi:hypothetical protein